MSLKFNKVRNVILKLDKDEDDIAVLDDADIDEMIIGLTSQEAIDEKGNVVEIAGSRCGDTIINIVKHPAEDTLKMIGADINIFKKVTHHIARVEVLTIVRRRIYDIYETGDN